MDDLIECPRCGFAQPKSPSCVSCGIIFAKYKKSGQQGNTQIYMSAVSDDQLESWAAPQPNPAAPPQAQASQAEGYDWQGGAGGLDPWADPVDYSQPGAGVADPYQQPDDSGGYGVSHDYFDEPGGGGQDWSGQAYATDDVLEDEPPSDTGPTAWRPDVVEPPAAAMDYAPPGPRTSTRRAASNAKSSGGASQPMPMAGRVVRAVLALGALGLTVMMVMGGQAFSSAVPFVAMVFFAGWALWGLTTVRREVSLKQFGIEFGVLAVGGVAIFLADSTVFRFGYEPPKPKEVKIVVAEPKLPDTALGTWTGAALSYTEGLASVLQLEETAGYEFWDKIDKALDWEKLREEHHLLPEDDKARSIQIMDSFKELAPKVSKAMEEYRTPAGAGYRFEAPEEVRAELEGLRAKTWSEVDRLKRLIQIFPKKPTVQEKPAAG